MDLIKIVPVEPEDGDYVAKSQGTRFYSGDTEIHGVVCASVHFAVDDAVRADLHLLCTSKVIDGALAGYFMEDPINGGERKVARIVWADGNETDLTT